MKRQKFNFYINFFMLTINIFYLGMYANTKLYNVSSSPQPTLFDWGISALLVVLFTNMMIKNLRKIIELENKAETE